MTLPHLHTMQHMPDTPSRKAYLPGHLLACTSHEQENACFHCTPLYRENEITLCLRKSHLPHNTLTLHQSVEYVLRFILNYVEQYSLRYQDVSPVKYPSSTSNQEIWQNFYVKVLEEHEPTMKYVALTSCSAFDLSTACFLESVQSLRFTAKLFCAKRTLWEMKLATGRGGIPLSASLTTFFAEHGLGEKEVFLFLHADNCTGQNKYALVSGG